MTEDECLFCRPGADDNRVVDAKDSCYARYDNFPAADGHLQVVPYRHVESFFQLSAAELADAYMLMGWFGGEAEAWTIGVNEGRAAGRTVDHVHIHMIPRSTGDVPDPRGGVRNILLGPSPDLWSTR